MTYTAEELRAMIMSDPSLTPAQRASLLQQLDLARDRDPQGLTPGMVAMMGLGALAGWMAGISAGFGYLGALGGAIAGGTMMGVPIPVKYTPSYLR